MKDKTLERPMVLLHRAVELPNTFEFQTFGVEEGAPAEGLGGGISRMLELSRLKANMQSAYTSKRPKDGPIERVKTKNEQVNDSE